MYIQEPKMYPCSEWFRFAFVSLFCNCNHQNSCLLTTFPNIIIAAVNLNNLCLQRSKSTAGESPWYRPGLIHRVKILAPHRLFLVNKMPVQTWEM